MKFIDLFAGLGGFHLALSRLGHECVFASEIETFLREHYNKNFKMFPEGDITKIKIKSIPKHDILCAGFPCQPFSKAGFANGFSHKIAGKMFFYLIKIIKYHKPKYLFLENVPNLIGHNNGETWEYMKKKISKIGYDVDQKILSPTDYNIPQIRNRLYIVAKKNKLTDFEWPKKIKQTNNLKKFLVSKPKKNKKLSELKKEVLDVWKYFLKKIPKKTYLPNPLWAMEFGATYPYKSSTPHSIGLRKLKKYKGKFGVNLKSLSKDEVINSIPNYAKLKVKKFPKWKIRMIKRSRDFYKQNKKWVDKLIKKIIKLESESYQKFEWNCQGETFNLKKKIVTFRGSGIRVRRNKNSPTLVSACITQVPYLPWKKRYLSLEECLNIQGFKGLKSYPKGYEKFYMTIGNAVNVEVVSKIAKQLLNSENAKRT